MHEWNEWRDGMKEWMNGWNKWVDGMNEWLIHNKFAAREQFELYNIPFADKTHHIFNRFDDVKLAY